MSGFSPEMLKTSISFRASNVLHTTAGVLTGQQFRWCYSFWVARAQQVAQVKIRGQKPIWSHMVACILVTDTYCTTQVTWMAVLRSVWAPILHLKFCASQYAKNTLTQLPTWLFLAGDRRNVLLYRWIDRVSSYCSKRDEFVLAASSCTRRQNEKRETNTREPSVIP